MERTKAETRLNKHNNNNNRNNITNIKTYNNNDINRRPQVCSAHLSQSVRLNEKVGEHLFAEAHVHTPNEITKKLSPFVASLWANQIRIIGATMVRWFYPRWCQCSLIWSMISKKEVISNNKNSM